MEETRSAMGAELMPPPGTNSIAREAWENVRTGLRSELGDATYNSWLKSMSLIEHSGNQVTMGVPTRFRSRLDYLPLCRPHTGAVANRR